MLSITLAFVLLSFADEPPRYQFEVGQKIIYAGKSESRYKDDKYDFNSDEAIKWTIWVVRKNTDGSWRLVLQSSKTTSMPGRDSVRRASPAETAMGYLDIHPDGRIVPNRSIGYHFDPLRLFPPMPVDVSGKGWESRVERDVSIHRYTPTASQTGGWGFQETIDSPMSRISLSTTTVDYTFDKGMVQRVEARKGRKFGVTGTETEILELKSIGMADVGQLAQESALLFDAYAAYWDQEDRSVTDASKHGKAESVLVEAREKLSNSILRDQVDTLLNRHRRSGSFGSERAVVFAQLLGKPGPEWEAKDLDGKTHSTKDYRGKVVILDFWDRGCGWCIRAMPQLKAIQDEFKGQPVQLLGMSLDEDEKNARLVVEQMGITHPTVRAIGLSEGYKVGGIPHLVILDQEGNIADIHVGYAPMLKERVSKTVRELLERK